jgi:hypothetical protein
MDDEAIKKDMSSVENTTMSVKKEKKKSSGSSRSNGKSSRNKKDSSLKSPRSESGLSLDTPRNVKFVVFAEEKSEATKICSTISVNLRKDHFGNLITKGTNKKQKLTWSDQVGGVDIPVVISVESYKKYNVDVSAEKANCNCTCCIF